MDVKTERKPFPYLGNKVARLKQGEKEKIKDWLVGPGVFEFAEGFEVLHTMFFYRCRWVDCVVFPKTMKYAEQYSLVPFVDTERKVYYHTPDDYEFPCDYRHRPSDYWWDISQFKRRPISVVVKNDKMKFHDNAFSDGEADIAIFLDFDSEYDYRNIKGNVQVYRRGTWQYKNGVPVPLFNITK